MLYRDPTQNVNHPELMLFTGRYLARQKFNRVERAFLAADLVNGTADLIKPTVLQAAALARVNVPYVHWAIRWAENRVAILAGELPLVPLRLPQAPLHLRSELNDADLINIAQLVGTDRMLEAAVAAEGNGHSA